MKKTLKILIFLMLFACVINLGKSMKHRWQLSFLAKKSAKPNLSSELISIVTLGNTAFADTLVEFWLSQGLVPDPGETLSHADFSQIKMQIIKFHPPKENLYILACVVANFQFHNPEDCKALLKVGMDLQPQSWRLAMMAGYLAAFHTKEMDEAAFYYRKAGKIKGAPKFLLSFSSKLEKQTDAHSDWNATRWESESSITNWRRKL